MPTLLLLLERNRATLRPLDCQPWRSGARLREVARLKHRERVNDLLPKSVAASDIEINGSIEPVKDSYHAQCMVNCRSAWQPIGQAM